MCRAWNWLGCHVGRTQEGTSVVIYVMLYVSQTIHDQSASLNTACVLQRLLLSRNHTVFNITDQHAGLLRTTCSVLD